MRKNLLVVDRNKASQGIRLINYVIDYIIVYSFFFFLGAFAMLLFQFVGVDFLLNFVNWIAELNRFQDILMTGFVYFSYTFLMEYFTKGRTIGKYITGTKVVSTDLQTIGAQQYFIRNISRLVPFDALSFLGNNGWHDSWSDTRVVNFKDLENARSRENDLQNLGKKENE